MREESKTVRTIFAEVVSGGISEKAIKPREGLAAEIATCG